MVFTGEDIRKNCPTAYAALPNLLKISVDGYIIVRYKTNYNDGSVSVEEIKTTPNITLGIYKNVPHPSEIAYFKQPFDSKNFLLYQILISLAGDAIEEIKSMYARFRLLDKEAAKTEAATVIPKYDEIFNSEDFRKSISKYVIGGKKQIVIDELCVLADTMQSYYEKKGESFYCGKLQKIISAIQDNNGNLIPDNLKARIMYMLVGEMSSISGAEPSLLEAKRQLRSNVSIGSIYDNTGWFYNKKDGKWRKQISDSDSYIAEGARLMDAHNNIAPTVYVKDGTFQAIPQNALNHILVASCGLDAEQLDKLPYLPQLLEHPTLYIEYPFLAYVKCFYGAMPSGDERYVHFFSAKDNMIVSLCDPATFHKHTVMLHEIQHAIQDYENWSRGGNSFLSMLGMESSESLRQFIAALGRVERVFARMEESKLKNVVYTLGLPESIDRKQVSSWFFNGVMNRKFELSAFQNTFSTDEYEIIYNSAQSASSIIELGNKYATRLQAQGFSGQRTNTGWSGEIGMMIFKSYQMLFGELEARFTQKSAMSGDFKDYFFPMSAETYKEEDLIIYTDEYEIKIGEKKNFLAAIEVFEGKFTMHLRSTLKAEPIAHELGHIAYDEFVNFPDLMSGYYKECSEKGVGHFEEHFVSCYLNYLKRKSQLPTLAGEITPTDSSVFVDKFLDHIFFAVEVGVFDYEIAERHLQFIKLVLQD